MRCHPCPHCNGIDEDEACSTPGFDYIAEEGELICWACGDTLVPAEHGELYCPTCSHILEDDY